MVAFIKKSIKIDYPNKLKIIFDKLDYFHIKPIIVGGYIRDKLLNFESKDIDVELYGCRSLDEVKNILVDFGKVNSVGKSFGVLKLSTPDLEIDFSLPRRESKSAKGHRGFAVITEKSLDFTTAASRRDFTINAMGYDIKREELLDPYGGRDDLKRSILKLVNRDKFTEDPLRVLRAVGFSARFELQLDKELITLCRSMVSDGALLELPQERIYLEFEKFLLKSKHPSIALESLTLFGCESFFGKFLALRELDYYAINKQEEKSSDLLILFSILYSKGDIQKIERVISARQLKQNIELFIHEKEAIDSNTLTNYQLFSLARRVNLEQFFIFLDAIHLGKKRELIERLKKRAEELHILHNEAKALIEGRDLIEQGLQPSPQFKKILEALYEAQMREEFKTKEQALEWLKKSSLLS